MSEEQTVRTRRFGKEIRESESSERKKKQSKRKFKSYSEYVYLGQQNVDITTLVPLTQDDYDYNDKIHQILEIENEYTYSELCAALGEKEKGGTAKQSQLATWFQHMTWEHPINPKTKKASKKFKILEIYDTPRQRINITFQLEYFKQKQLECNFIFSIINNDNLHEEVGEFRAITGIKAKDMYQNIGLVNETYYLVRSNKESISDFIPINNQIELFKQIENSNKKFTTGALSRLSRSNVIESYAYTYIWTDEYQKDHLATDQEHLAIEDGIKEMIDYAREWGHKVETIADLYNGKIKHCIASDLKDYMLDIIKKDIPTIKYFSRGFKVVYLKSKMKGYLEEIANESNQSFDKLQSIKLFETRKEHSDIQVNKAIKRNQHKPLVQDKEVRLINVVINNSIDNPLTDQEIQLKEDKKLIIDRATMSEYISSLAIDDINELVFKVIESERQKNIEQHEQKQLDNLIEEAISYCCMPITVINGSNRNQMEFIDLNDYLDKYQQIDSIYIQCKLASKTGMCITLHINYTVDTTKKSNNLNLMLSSMYDVKYLQAYLVVSYNVNVKVGQERPQEINLD